MTIELTHDDIARAERICREANDGHDAYAGSVLTAARMLKLARKELLEQIAEALAPSPPGVFRPATDTEILEHTRELVAKLLRGAL